MSEAVEIAIAISVKDMASAALGKLSGKFNELGTAGKAVVAGIAATTAATAAAVGGIIKLADSSAAAAGEVKRLARETGLGAIESSKLLYAGHKLGLDTDTLSQTFGKLSKSLVTNKDEFAKLGIEIVKNKAGNVDFSSTLGNIAEKFKAMPDGVEKSELAMKIFGKTGKDLIPFLNQGKDGLAALGAEAARMGLVFDDKALAAATRFRLAQKNLGEDLAGLKNQIGMAFIPILADMASALLGLAERVLPTIVAGIGRFRDGVGIAIGVVKDMVAAFQGQQAGGGDFLSSIIGPQAAGDFMGLVTRIGESLGAFHTGVVTPLFNYLKAQAPIVWDAVKTAIGNFWAAAGPILETSIRNAFSWLVDNVPGIWDAVKNAVVTAWGIIEPVLKFAWQRLEDLKTKFSELPPAAQHFLEAAAIAGLANQALGDPIGDTINKFSQLAQGIAAIGSEGGAISKIIEKFGALKLALGVFGLIGAVIALKIAWDENWGDIQTKTETATKNSKAFITGLTDELGKREKFDTWISATNDADRAVNPFRENLRGLTGDVEKNNEAIKIQTEQQKIWEQRGRDTGAAIHWLDADVLRPFALFVDDQAWKAVSKLVENFKDWDKVTRLELAPAIRDILGGALKNAGENFDLTKKQASEFFTGMGTGITVAVDLVRVGFRDFLNAVATAINGAIDLVNPLWTLFGNPPIPHVHIDLPDVADAEKRLRDLVQPRDQNTSVALPNWTDAEWRLNDIARRRLEPTDVVLPNWTDAEWRLNDIARHREATIAVRVLGGDVNIGGMSVGAGASGMDHITKPGRPELLLVGEAGQEHIQVTPLAKGTGSPSGGGTYYMTFNIESVDSADRVRQLADAIQNLLTMDARRSGIIGEALAR
ncbi:MAG: hypothetical protein M3O91_04115 [Chloroflexota bacterium]|nr:hypothetical protein [Chloroflexota bacterium]